MQTHMGGGGEDFNLGGWMVGFRPKRCPMGYAVGAGAASCRERVAEWPQIISFAADIAGPALRAFRTGPAPRQGRSYAKTALFPKYPPRQRRWPFTTSGATVVGPCAGHATLTKIGRGVQPLVLFFEQPIVQDPTDPYDSFEISNAQAP